MLAVILAFAAFCDFRYRKIPDEIDFLLGIYAVLISGAEVYDRMAGFLLTAGTMCLLQLASGKIKGGDVKFLALCAAADGLCAFVPVLVLSCVFALVWSAVKREKSVPLALMIFAGYLVGREGLIL